MKEDTQKKSKMEASNHVGDENNNVRLKDPPANYRTHLWKYFWSLRQDVSKLYTSS
jgi:hypothetical protein